MSFIQAITRLSRWKLAAKAEEWKGLDIGDEGYRDIFKSYKEVRTEKKEARQHIRGRILLCNNNNDRTLMVIFRLFMKSREAHNHCQVVSLFRVPIEYLFIAAKLELVSTVVLLPSLNPYLTNAFSHYQLGESTFISRGVMRDFYFSSHFSMKFLCANRITWDAAFCGVMLFAYVPQKGRQAYLS